MRTGRVTRGGLAIALVAVLCGDASAPAQMRAAPSPDPEALWERYPLRTEDGRESARAPNVPARRADPPPAPAPPREADGGSWLATILPTGAAGLLLAGSVVVLRRRQVPGRRTPAVPETALAAVASPARSPSPAPEAAVSSHAERLTDPSLLGLAPEPQAVRAVARDRRVPESVALAATSMPPVDGQACDVVWRAEPGGGRFEALEHDERGGVRVVAASPDLAWPFAQPPAATSQAVAAHGALLDDLAGAGWQPVGRPFPWYARRLHRPKEPVHDA